MKSYINSSQKNQVSFMAAMLAQWIPLRPDVICGLMVVGCLVIATVRVLIEAARDD